MDIEFRKLYEGRLLSCKCKAVGPEKVELIREHSRCDLSLDAGCGDGAYLPYFKSKEVIAVDISLNRLKRTKKHRKANFLLADITRLPLKNDIFQFIWCSELIEHLDKTSVRVMLQEFKRICENGFIVVTTPNHSFLPELIKNFRDPKRIKRFVGHINLYNPKTLRKQGFNVTGILGAASADSVILGNPSIRGILKPLLHKHPSLSSMLVGIIESA